MTCVFPIIDVNVKCQSQSEHCDFTIPVFQGKSVATAHVRQRNRLGLNRYLWSYVYSTLHTASQPASLALMSTRHLFGNLSSHQTSPFSLHTQSSLHSTDCPGFKGWVLPSVRQMDVISCCKGQVWGSPWLRFIRFSDEIELATVIK